MKKFIVFALLFFLLIVLFMGAMENEEKVKAKGSSKVCTYTSVPTENEELEIKRAYVENSIRDPELTNAVLAVYEVENYENLDYILTSFNDMSTYTDGNNINVQPEIYIQSYRYGIDYMTWIIDRNESISMSINKLYESEKGITDTQYNYYLSVLSKINKSCSMGVDGLPLVKPYTISGWYPFYGKDGSGVKHYGIDISVPVNTAIYAVADGEVIKTGTGCEVTGFIGSTCGADGYTGGGNHVVIKIIDGDDFYLIHYDHMATIEVEKGYSVVKGELLGTSGSSGNSSGPHLHYEVHKGGQVLDVGSERGIINPCEFTQGLCEDEDET